jgi:predicted nuclease of predicted toxin-antitoxin system
MKMLRRPLHWDCAGVEIDITTTPEAGLLGASDDKQLAFAAGETRVMVSHDADMLRLSVGGFPHCGIAYCKKQKYKVGQLILRLLALSGRISAEDMNNRIEFL